MGLRHQRRSLSTDSAVSAYLRVLCVKYFSAEDAEIRRDRRVEVIRELQRLSSSWSRLAIVLIGVNTNARRSPLRNP